MSASGCAGYFQDRSKLYITVNELTARFTHLLSNAGAVPHAPHVG
jgi:hypothetical protein